MGKVWNRFILLMWKNYKQHVRHPIQTLLEILAPVLFAVTLLILRSIIPLSKHDKTVFSPFEASVPQIANVPTKVVWSPTDPVLDKIMNHTIKTINEKAKFEKFTHYSFKNSKELTSYLTNEVNIITTLAGIQFKDDFNSAEDFGSQINITLRFPAELRTTFMSKYETWRTQYLFAGFGAGPRDEILNDGALPSYNGEGFLILQQELSFSIIKHLKETLNGSIPEFPEIFLQRFPNPAWITDKLMLSIQSSVGIIFLLAYIYSTINIVKTVAYEKEKQLREVMKIMGLPNWLHWTVWTLKFFISLCVTAVLMIIVLQTGWYPNTTTSVFARTDPNVLFVFLLCFSCATISFCFAVSAFFTNASTAATFTGLLWFLLYVPYYFIERFYSRYSFAEKLASCLCSNTAMAYGFRLILRSEESGKGYYWDDVLNFEAEDLSLGYIMVMLLVDSVLYFIITLYVGTVFPGDFGVPEKWYFPFSRSYWCGITYKQDTEEDNATNHMVQSEHFEIEPNHLQAGVKIRRLNKTFKGNKVAVNDLTLNMYKDQISVVLGHNGAGKTTTMSILIGMFPPTSGTAIIGGCDIRNNILGVRRSLGLCPQHNVLFDELTVSEHIYFYSRLKGLTRDKTNAEISKYIKILELETKANAKASTLSGGMKRKLSIAVAFCGDSEVVMLDEPTAGMDPSARRLVWDLLQTEKKGRTVVLTTHFMDEADFLGDRIAIMSNGKLQCCGSSFFLKKKYGAGYHLIIDKSTNCNVDNVTQLLNRYIPNIEVSSNVGSELVYILSEEFAKTFEQMLCDLEDRSQDLGINTYGISLSTLEEVFMRVGAETTITPDEFSTKTRSETNISDLQSLETLSIVSNYSETKLFKDDIFFSGWRLWFNQVQATFIKRLLSIWRNWILLVVQIIIPIVFVIFIIIITIQAGGLSSLPKLMITLDDYSNPITLLNINKNNLYTDSYVESLLSDNYTVAIWKDLDMNTLILEQMEKVSKSDQRNKYILGATMHANQTITGWFNNIPYHSAPLTLQLILNAILHKEVSPEFNVQFFNYPLPYSDFSTKLDSLLQGTSDKTSMALNISFAMAFVSSFYVLFYIRERANKSKHLQFVSGMNIIPFWIPSFLVDYLTFTITSACLVFTIAPFQIQGFATVPELGRFLSLLLVFGAGMLPVMYLSTFFFDNPSTGYTRVTFFNVFTGVGAYLVIKIAATSDLDLTQVRKILDWMFIIFPHYSLIDGINALLTINSVNSICNAAIDQCSGTSIPEYWSLSRLECKLIICYIEKQCCNMNSEKFYTWLPPGILRNVLVLIMVGVVSFAIVLSIEYRILQKIHGNLFKKPFIASRNADTNNRDTDVELEEQRVQMLSQNDLMDKSLVMQNITKYYGKSAAVQGVSLIVNRFECFGLLGVNGAGKTTTFKIMTGDINATYGSAWIYGLNLDTDMKAIQRIIGYCPQFDALLDELTAKETLLVYGLIRGIPRSDIPAMTEKLATDFNFYKHLDKKVKELSGGNKRKLSTSLALIGDPKILYLDEPTTGMDPVTKRYLWDCICKVRDSGKCIILTSHSMEECEALCTRLAIMVNGQLMCLGSTQYLKSKFSNTCTLVIKIKRTDEECNTERVENFVHTNFQNALLREKHKELLIFSISGENQRWSKMFGLMEGAKQYLNIDDYSLGQCNLEQVFLRLTKYQTDD